MTMYNILNNESQIRATSLKSFGLDYVKRELMDVHVNRYKEYRRDNPGYVKSNHILTRILGMIDIPFTGNLPDYYIKVTGIINRLSGVMGFCTDAHHGRVFSDSEFYGKGVGEVFIAVGDDTLTPSDIWNNWREMSPVRILSHPFYGCGVVELDGRLDLPTVPSGSMVIIEINIPLLACQYQLWNMASRFNLPDGVNPPVSNFITQVVIPNVLESHLDVGVLNSIHHLLGGSEYGFMDSDMPFYVTDYWPRLEKGLNEVVERFTSQKMYWRDVLANIPVFGKTNLLQTIELPDVAQTNQVIWALMAARLNCCAMLLKLDSLSNNERNDADKVRIRRSLIEADSGKYLTARLPREVADYFEQFIKTYIEPYL